MEVHEDRDEVEHVAVAQLGHDIVEVGSCREAELDLIYARAIMLAM